MPRLRRYFGWWVPLVIGVSGCATSARRVPDSAPADALVADATAAYYRGDYTTAKTGFDDARRSYAQNQDWEGAAYAWNNLGSVALRQRDYTAAEEYFRRARGLFEEIADNTGTALAANNLGTALRELGHFDDARQAHEHARALAEAEGDLVVEAAAQSGLGLLLLEMPDSGAAEFTEAERRFRVALALQEKAGDEMGQAATLGNLGAVAALRDEVPAAIAHYAAALERDRQLGHVSAIAQDVLVLAELHLRAREPETARTFAERALRMYEDMADDTGAQRATEVLDAIAAARAGG